MGQPHAPESVKLMAGLLATAPALLAEAAEALAAEFGPIDATSQPYRWTESAYYAGEMGTELWRQFLSFVTLIDPGTLAAVKRRTNELEVRWRDTTGRRVNVDPGYLSATKLVLASTKDAAQRIYLRDGIYAEATLRFIAGSWQSYPYTYQDYAGANAVVFFNEARRTFLMRRRAAGPPGQTPAASAPSARSRAAAPGRRSRVAAPG